MQEKKRGRKPKPDGDRIDKIGCVRYKCPYAACSLEYQSSLGYKRHLMYYKHSIFAPSTRKIVCGFSECMETHNLKEHIQKMHPEDAPELLEAHDIMVKVCEETDELPVPQVEHDIVHDEGLLDISRVMEKDSKIKDILLSTFPKGITYIIDFDTFHDNNQIYYCRIPGCGRQFKSLMAYKYHCGKFTHMFKSIVDEYSRQHKPQDYEEVKQLFKKEFNLENRFLLEGVSHHLMRMPDQHYNFIFTFDDTQTGHEKRRIRRKSDHVSEYALGSEDTRDTYDEEEYKKHKDDNEEYKHASKIESIVFNGKKLPNVRCYSQGRVSFTNLHSSATTISQLDNHVLVCVKGDLETSEEENHHNAPMNIFSFSTGNASIYVLEEDKIIREAPIKGFGYIRKAINTGSRTMLMLFNDGILREIKFTKEYKIEKIKKIETNSLVVDFIVFKKMVIVYTHRNLINLNTSKILPCDVPIISMGNTSERILLADVNGNTYWTDDSFEDLHKMHMKVKIGTDIISGLGTDPNLIFVSNSFYGMGRIMEYNSQNVLLVSPHASSNAILIKEGFIVSSGLDGTICVSGYLTEPKVYMKLIRAEIKGDSLYLTTSDEEHALTQPTQPSSKQEYRATVIGLVPKGNTLVGLLACGVVIFVKDFFKEPVPSLDTHV
ncbi:hypothetical protein NEOKW01_1567 [Nematocida sp. AWRm80]|nr:hypothetical protein NEOKW01_1567 [Nematocida sp. AWRm80]